MDYVIGCDVGSQGIKAILLSTAGEFAGAAFLALAGIGAYATLSEASEHLVKIREYIDPDPRTQSTYTESYERYRQTYFALLPIFEEAAKRTD